MLRLVGLERLHREAQPQAGVDDGGDDDELAVAQGHPARAHQSGARLASTERRHVHALARHRYGERGGEIGGECSGLGQHGQQHDAAGVLGVERCGELPDALRHRAGRNGTGPGPVLTRRRPRCRGLGEALDVAA